MSISSPSGTLIEFGRQWKGLRTRGKETTNTCVGSPLRRTGNGLAAGGSWPSSKKNLMRIMRVLHRREAYKRSYWARQEVPQKGDLGDRESTKTSLDDSELDGILRTG